MEPDLDSIDREALSSPVVRALYDVTKAVRLAEKAEADPREVLQFLLEVASFLEEIGVPEVAKSVLGLATGFSEQFSIDGHKAN